MPVRIPGPPGGPEVAGSLTEAIASLEGWPVELLGAAAAAGAFSATHGEVGRQLPVASVTKLLTAWAALVAVEEGAVSLEDPVGPPGSSLWHLLCHAGGWNFDGTAVLAPPGRRRIYSNRGYEEVAAHIERSSGIRFADYLSAAVLDPLGLRATELRGGAAKGAWSTVEDLDRFCAELHRPTLLEPPTVERFRTPQLPDLVGTVPGWGRFDPCPWGLGPELKGAKEPHWMGSTARPECLGHFGGSGSFLWLEPATGIRCVVVGDRPFGEWAVGLWPGFSDRVRGAGLLLVRG
jgi:CubicO group peptidase (beta-lactamase class C family)